MSRMHKRHFEIVGHVIEQARVWLPVSYRKALANDFATAFIDEPGFDHSKFIKACGLGGDNGR